MKIVSAEIRNVRIIKEKSLEFDTKTLIYGQNGSGKTSVLESINLAVTGKSFRTSNIREAIRDQSDFLYIRTEVEDEQGFYRDISFGTDRRGTRKMTLDGDNVERKELLSISSIVIHKPDDTALVKGSPSLRRDFLDKAVFIGHRDYIRAMVNYRRYLKHKSVLLKSNKPDPIRHLNRAVIPFVNEIREKRKALADTITVEINNLFNHLDTGFSLEFVAPFDEDPYSIFEEKLPKEMERGYSLYGPHVDNIQVKVEGRNGRSLSSGELYFLSLLLKISEMKIHAENGIYPIFMVDDIFSFLDSSNREKVAHILSEIDNQVLLTGTSKVQMNKFSFIEMTNSPE